MTTSPASISLDQLSIDTLRLLAVDEVEKAKSGHPGAPLGCAPIAYLLYHKLMKHNPKHFKWADRDRFVLSNGHASALLYASLYLSGYNLPLDELKQFRQWHSKTPGHPESLDTEGVEVTTGPLGQGFGMAVGMTIAEKHLAAIYNKPGFNVVDHHTYVLCGDGDLMEGISHEAASLAGTLNLGKLIVLYDDNLISLDGPTELSFTEDVLKRFEAYHWHTQRLSDGNDLDAIESAIEAAKAETNRPSLIAVRTVIGYGSPKAGTNKVHGEALGAADAAATKKYFGFPEDQSFYVPEDSLKNWRTAIDRGQAAEAEWNKLFESYAKQYPDLAEQFQRTQKNKRKAGWEKALPTFPAGKPVATRNAGGAVMNAIADVVPELFGGAADLTSSTKTIFKPGANFHQDPAGRNVFFGVREFGMCAAVNGVAAHQGLVPFGSTFFTFSDYCKPAIRLAALSRAHSIFVFTHDSIGLGEDGPTHQPIEHLMMPRGSLSHRLPSCGCQRDRRLLAPGPGAQRSVLLRSEPAGPAGHRYHQGRRFRRGQQRRLRSGRRRQAAGHSYRHRLGDCALCRGEEGARKRRHSGARRQHAELGDLRGTIGRVQGKCSARRSAKARRGSRLAAGLVEVCGSGWRRDRA